ncbi:hypothetical protein KBC04_00360 [Candidatus Babeliales bacterium]|nr:hypothetical protein [Candidatus Babeliales bacterium]MBP9843456.1 hypothetical protein [Candidatus Babeliales bacterium]
MKNIKLILISGLFITASKLSCSDDFMQKWAAENAKDQIKILHEMEERRRKEHYAKERHDKELQEGSFIQTFLEKDRMSCEAVNNLIRQQIIAKNSKESNSLCIENPLKEFEQTYKKAIEAIDQALENETRKAPIYKSKANALQITMPFLLLSFGVFFNQK